MRDHAERETLREDEREQLLKSYSLKMGVPMAQDPVKVDSKHYKVEFENDKVRVLRVSYPPGEKSVMHGHPNVVGVVLADAGGTFTYPDGRKEDIDMKAGQAMWFPAVEHLPENRLDKPIHLILVELKY
jgi:quercetin dioxygenase-like cupin family protein